MKLIPEITIFRSPGPGLSRAEKFKRIAITSFPGRRAPGGCARVRGSPGSGARGSSGEAHPHGPSPPVPSQTAQGADGLGAPAPPLRGGRGQRGRGSGSCPPPAGASCSLLEPLIPVLPLGACPSRTPKGHLHPLAPAAWCAPGVPGLLVPPHPRLPLPLLQDPGLLNLSSVHHCLPFLASLVSPLPLPNPQTCHTRRQHGPLGGCEFGALGPTGPSLLGLRTSPCSDPFLPSPLSRDVWVTGAAALPRPPSQPPQSWLPSFLQALAQPASPAPPPQAAFLDVEVRTCHAG